MDVFDLVIVGAGVHGLATLKTYRDVHPEATTLVLDKSLSLGGVWAEERLYPGLKTNNHFGTYEFSDFPMSTQGYSPENDHIPGKNVSEYLQSYADKYELTRHIRFNCRVEAAIDEGDSGWTISVEENKAGQRSLRSIKAAKLIVATGLTSEPFVPKMVGSDTFNAPIYHITEFAKAEAGLGPYKKVVVLSGAKSSWDMACAYASAGIHVNWVIRESGHGPCWMSPNRLTPLKIIPEVLLQIRLVTWLSPCVWADATGFASIFRFFHRHWLGRKIVNAFFHKMEHSILENNKYESHPETAKLRPWDGVFFIGSNRGLLNYDVDIFEFVRNGTISIHIADITELSDHTVHLSDGQELDADVLICGTGWKDTPHLNFVTERELGLPGFTSSAASKLIPKAEAEILEKCPRLKDQPEPRKIKPMSDNATETKSEPYRLYRFMVPPAFAKSRTLAFAGAYRSPAVTMMAQAQALWITAFFDEQLPALADPSIKIDAPVPTGGEPFSKPSNALEAKSRIAKTADLSDRILYETVLHSQFGKWRYSKGFGARFPELWFECLPYVDLLLRDIGIENKRKRSWWNERFTPYFPKDYLGITKEYLELKDQRVKKHGY